MIEAVEKWEKRVKIDEVRLMGLKDHKLSFKVVLMSGDEIEVRA